MRLILLISILFATSCSYINSWVPRAWQPSHDKNNLKSPALVSSSSDEIPFVLNLDKEQLLNQELMVRGSIEARADWKPSEIGVRLVGLRDGEVVRDSIAKFVDQPNDILRKGDRLEFVGNLASDELTDYQLELVWGDDSAQLSVEPQKASLDTSMPLQALQIEDLSIQKSHGDCVDERCVMNLRLKGVLRNKSGQIVDSANLGVGFVFLAAGQALDLESTIPQNEELLELKALRLGPGMKRAFRLVIDQQVPEMAHGEYVPVVRVVSSGVATE